MKAQTKSTPKAAPSRKEGVPWISKPTVITWHNFPKLLQIVPVLGMLAVGGSGCGQKEISGEAFTKETVKRGDARREEVVPLAGLPVFFLTESENRRLNDRMSKLKKKIDADLAAECWKLTNGLRYVAPDDFPSLKTNSLILTYRKFAPEDKRSDEDIFKEVVERYPSKVFEYPDAKYYVECERASKAHLEAGISVVFAPDPLDFFDQEIAEILDKSQSVTTDSEGKFKVVPRSRDFYVVAKKDKSRWRFRFSASGQKLVLSDDNCIRENN